jgi:large subunit ribosomal protein L24|tara:strand:+ start:8533 stop:8847 length:315 start_codon:yes stop_codon:yes gene_type:complete
MNKLRLKIGDQVKIITGRNKDNTGTIKSFLKKKNMLIVDKCNLKIKHQKPANQENSGQITEIEAPIHLSNVMLCDSDLNASRFSTLVIDSKKVRVSKKTKKTIL